MWSEDLGDRERVRDGERVVEKEERSEPGSSRSCSRKHRRFRPLSTRRSSLQGSKQASKHQLMPGKEARSFASRAGRKLERITEALSLKASDTPSGGKRYQTLQAPGPRYACMPRSYVA